MANGVNSTAAGAAVGTAIFPGVGTVIGGAIGGLFGGHKKKAPPPAPKILPQGNVSAAQNGTVAPSGGFTPTVSTSLILGGMAVGLIVLLVVVSGRR